MQCYYQRWKYMKCLNPRTTPDPVWPFQSPESCFNSSQLSVCNSPIVDIHFIDNRCFITYQFNVLARFKHIYAVQKYICHWKSNGKGNEFLEVDNLAEADTKSRQVKFDKTILLIE